MDQQFASIYRREQGDSRIRWVDGAFPLAQALEVFHGLIDDEITEPLAALPGTPMYYEIRGVGRCAVRARAWIVRGVDTVRYEIMPPVFPGRRVDGR